MANQIQKKFILDGAVDGLKIKLLKDQALVGTLQDGSSVDLIKLDGSDKVLVKGVEVGLKSEIDQVVIDYALADDAKLVEAKAYTDAQIAAIPPVDISGKADITYVDLQDTAKLIEAKAYTDAQIAAIPPVDISGKADITYVDSQDAAKLLEAKAYADGLDLAMNARVSAVEAIVPEVIEAADFASLPGVGDVGKIYVTKDLNKIYRYSQSSTPTVFDWTVGATGDFASLEAALASASVVDGHKIKVLNGTYLVSSTINVAKKVAIVGESKAGVIFQTAGTSSDPVSMFNVSVDDVAMATMTIKHKKTSNTSVEAAIVASGGGFPQTRIKNFIAENLHIEFAEFGIVTRGESWVIRGCKFVYATGTVSNSNRCVGLYGVKGNCYLYQNVLDNSVLNSSAFRPFYLTSTNGTNPNETCSGTLYIEGQTQLGTVAQFFNQDNNQYETVGGFNLVIKDNVINETNLFAGFSSSAANAGDMFGAITLSGNSLSNLHAADGGKGVFGVYSTANFRTTPLVVHAANNILANTVYRTGWEAVEGTIVGKEVATPVFTVALDADIPATPAVPEAPGGSVVIAEYVELSATDASITSDIATLQGQMLAAEGEIDALQSDVSALESDMGQAQTDISGLQSSLSSAQGAIVALENSVSTLQGQMTTAEGEIDTLQSEMAQAKLDIDAIELSVGAANGIAPLDATGKIASTYLPSYVDDVLEFASLAAFPEVGEAGKIYVALDTNKTYRWSGSAYIEISASEVDSVNGKTGIVVLSAADVDMVAKAKTVEAELGDLDGRITTLENAPVLTFNKEDFTAESPLTDITLAFEAKAKSLVVVVGRLMLNENVDYSVSVVAGKTKLTWIGDFAVGGVEGIEAGDKIYVTYAYMV